MNLRTIERNPETKQLEAVFSFNDNLTMSIPVKKDKVTIPMIETLARSLELDADFFIVKYKVMLNDLVLYSKFRTDLIRKKRICTACHNDIFFRLVCGETLSMSEIYWFDWYVKKNKLTRIDHE